MANFRFNTPWLYIVGLGLWASDLLGQSTKKTLFKLPDTGLQTSFTSTFGEDHDYSINLPSYSLHSPTVVFDSNTLLMWQKADGGEMSIESARIYCDTLTLGGFTDWRLPTALEAYSIIYVQKTPPALNLSFFTNTGAEYWWTSETQFGDTTKIWVSNAGGGIGNHSKLETVSAGGTKKFHARAVRNTFSQPIRQRFAVHQNCIYDSLTSLLWVQYPDTVSKTWEESLVYAENFALGTLTDWRLPNLKEMQSIVDLSTSNPCIRKGSFPMATTAHYWTSTAMPNQTDKAWYLDTKFGITTYALKTVKKKCWVVCNESISNPTKDIQRNSLFEIYPNPCQDYFNIKFLGTTASKGLLNSDNSEYEITLRLRNSLGQCVFEQTTTLLNEPISTEDLPQGIYTVEISSYGNSFSELVRLVVGP